MYKKLLLTIGLLAILPTQSMDLGTWRKLKNRATSSPWADDLSKYRSDIDRPGWFSRLLFNPTSASTLISLGTLNAREKLNGSDLDEGSKDAIEEGTNLLSLSLHIISSFNRLYPKTKVSRLPYGAQQFAEANVNEQDKRTWAIYGLRSTLKFGVELAPTAVQHCMGPEKSIAIDSIFTLLANRIDTTLCPYSDQETADGMVCGKCIQEAASVVPRSNSEKGREWHQKGHKCREELEAIAHEKTDVPCDHHKKPETTVCWRKWWQRLWRK